MSYHYSNYGNFSGELKRLADLDGYVPEPGDSHDDFRWERWLEWDDEEWAEHVSAAEAAKRRADAALAEWREFNR